MVNEQIHVATSIGFGERTGQPSNSIKPLYQIDGRIIDEVD